MPANKTTGWKAPLLFMGAIAAVTAIIYVFMPGEPALQPLPAALEQKARETQIDMETEENKHWKDAMVDAASGFASQEGKDAKLLALARKALSQGNMSAACAIAVLIKGQEAANAAREGILQAALADCGRLHYGVFAVRDDEEMAERLKRRYEQCNGK